MSVKVRTFKSLNINKIGLRNRDSLSVYECLSKWQFFSFERLMTVKTPFLVRSLKLNIIKPYKYFSRPKRLSMTFPKALTVVGESHRERHSDIKPVTGCSPASSMWRTGKWRLSLVPSPRYQKEGQIIWQRFAVRSWWMFVIWSVKKRIHFSIKISTKFVKNRKSGPGQSTLTKD